MTPAEIAEASTQVPGNETFLPAGQPLPALPIAANAPAALLGVITRAAADSTLDLDRVERLLVLYEKMTAKQAEQQFVEAMARFKANAPRISKDKLVSFPSERGGNVSYRHATIGEVCDKIVPALAAVGISHRWDLERREARIYVTCVLTHEGGHSTRTTWDGAPDDSGKKNTLQQGASTITYLERYTLLAATGIGVSEQDDDGKAASAAERDPPPDGYDSWKADMSAIDTHEHLSTAWAKSNGLFRAYATLNDSEWWEATKAKAKKGV